MGFPTGPEIAFSEKMPTPWNFREKHPWSKITPQRAKAFQAIAPRRRAGHSRARDQPYAPRRSPRRSHSRPLGLTLCLMALSVTGGCAHFREGAERARGRDDGGSSTAAPAPSGTPPRTGRADTGPRAATGSGAGCAPPAAPVSPAPVTSAEPDNSKAEAASRKAAAAASRAAEADSRKAQAAADKAQRVQDKAARHAEKAAPPAPAPVREPIAVAGPTVDRVPAPVPQPAPAPVPAPVPMAPRPPTSPPAPTPSSPSPAPLARNAAPAKR
jgi:hypothetical protein